MARFHTVAGVHNLTPPGNPLRVRGVVLEKAPQPRLISSTLGTVIQTSDPIVRAELMWALPELRKMAPDCILRAEFEAADPPEAVERALEEFQKLLLAIEFITVKAVALSGPGVIPKEFVGTYIFFAPKKSYRGGAASVEEAELTVLKEIMDTLDAQPTTRIVTAQLEYDTALKSDDVRRQLIHAVIALEALFGDGETEAINYKVRLRALKLIPSLRKNVKQGMQLLKDAYTLRSSFVHGTWNKDTLRKADSLMDELLAATAEGVLEFVFRIKDSRSTEFPTLDTELFLSCRFITR